MQRTAGCLMAFAAVALAIPDSRRALQATAGTALNVPTNGASVPSEITTTGGNEWFKFTAQAGHTYQVECIVAADGTPGALEDSYMYLLGTDQSELIAENDDNPSDQDNYGSFIEWTCPADGTYYIKVRAYGRETGSFSVQVTGGAGGVGGVGGGDPCHGGTNLPGARSDTVVDFTADGAYGDNAECTWHIDCGSSGPPVVTMTTMHTEQDYDFVTMYSGADATAAQLARLSGELSDLDTTVYTAQGSAMTLQFTSDGSVTAGGFAMSYTCGTPPPPPPRVVVPPPPPTAPVPPPPGVTVEPAVPIQTTGANNPGTIASQFEHKWFSFQGQANVMYQIEVVIGGAGDVPDTVLQIVDTDRQTVLSENDDDERDPSSLASYIEWTAPRNAMFYVMVKGFDSDMGTFNLRVTAQTNMPDPCTQPLTMQGSTSTDTLSFMPAGEYGNQADCNWVLSCSNPRNAVTLTVTQLNTETDFDYVNLFDGATAQSHAIDQISGDLINLATPHYHSTGPQLLVEFTSDESIDTGGFEIQYSCGPPPPPPPPPPLGPPPPPPPVAPPPPDHVVDTGFSTATAITTMGSPIDGQIEQDGDEAWFSFAATAGTTYQIETMIGGQGSAYTLTDTIITLTAPNRLDIINQNDDDDRLDPATGQASGALASYMEWTCQQDGTYFLEVTGYGGSTGTFAVEVTPQAAGSANDPCSGDGMMMAHTGGSVVFQPESGTPNDATCHWVISCPQAGTIPTVSVTALETEQGFDFVKLYDGPTAAGAPLVTWSGSMADFQTAHTPGTVVGHQQTMVIEFTSDESIGMGGFNAAYACSAYAPPPPPPPVGPPPPPPHGAATNVMHLADTDGHQYQGNVATEDAHEIYQFQTTAGHTYSIETVPGTLPDTVIDLVAPGPDGHMGADIVTENDDDERAGASTYGSYIEWTAPVDANYFVLVKAWDTDTGTFTITITDQTNAAATGGGGGGGSGDPCSGGATLHGSGSISYQPIDDSGNSGTPDDQRCDWTVSCPAGQLPGVSFSSFDTEGDFDFVHLYDGTAATGTQLAELTGPMVDLAQTTFAGQSANMLLEFTSDESIGGRGFVADYCCSADGSCSGGGGH